MTTGLVWDFAPWSDVAGQLVASFVVLIAVVLTITWARHASGGDEDDF